VNGSGKWQNVADSAIGFLGAVGMVALLVLNGYEFGRDEGRKQAYRDFECPREAVYVTVRQDLGRDILETKCTMANAIRGRK
jgi:hypothetical protein